jgi:hypothetical protein
MANTAYAIAHHMIMFSTLLLITAVILFDVDVVGVSRTRCWRVVPIDVEAQMGAHGSDSTETIEEHGYQHSYH